MIYNTSIEEEKSKSDKYYSTLRNKGRIIEIKDLTPKEGDSEKAVKQRTALQNNLVNKWFRVIADYQGCTFEKSKHDVKEAILGQKTEVNSFTGEITKRDYATHEMSIKELSDFMDKFKIWAQTDLNVYLPYFGDPGYNELIEYYKNE